ncbi:MAG: SGNH/GDSL hydrolase family protein [Janthinobacterium lividum]
MSFRIESSQTLVCLGDSITQAAPGYVSLMADLIAAKYPERGIAVINSGIGGHRAPDLWERVERDVLAHHPHWVTVNVGINDVWHGVDGGTGGVPLTIYEPTVERIVQRIQEDGTQVVLVTPTVIGEDINAPANKILADYVAAMERIAERRNTLLAPAHTDFLMALKAGQAVSSAFQMTTDSVHLNAVGNARLALTILETLQF